MRRGRLVQVAAATAGTLVVLAALAVLADVLADAGSAPVQRCRLLLGRHRWASPPAGCRRRRRST